MLIIITLFLSINVLATHNLNLDRETVKNIAKLKRTTARYQNVNNAIRSGYISTVECVSSPLGAMGIHYVNPSLIDDKLEEKKPEALLYIPTKRGLKLVGVEYFIPKALTTSHPTLLGRNLDGPMPGHSPEQPEHYELHFWVWENNPSGIFSPWNPEIGCNII